MTTREKIAHWKVMQSIRCAQWIRGTQCHHFRMHDSRYCGLHGKGTRP